MAETISKLTVKIDNGTAKSVAVNTRSYDISDLASGDHTIVISATCQHGKVSSKSYTFTVPAAQEPVETATYAFTNNKEHIFIPFTASASKLSSISMYLNISQSYNNIFTLTDVNNNILAAAGESAISRVSVNGEFTDINGNNLDAYKYTYIFTSSPTLTVGQTYYACMSLRYPTIPNLIYKINDISKNCKSFGSGMEWQMDTVGNTLSMSNATYGDIAIELIYA